MGFGPIASDWTPRRTALGGTYDRAWLEQAWPYLPADFDWSYFNAAPASLQASALEGDEPYELLGVHPEKAHSAIRGRLPGVSVRALALGKTESGTRLTEVPLRIDTVRFDAEALTVSLTWRGALAVSGPTAPELDRVFFFTERLGAERPLTEMFGEVTRTVLERYGADAIPVTKQEREAAREPRPPSHGERPTTDGASAGVFLAGCTTLEGADLSGFDLREQDLRGQNMRGARLVGAWLHGAKLDGADLRGAFLVRARGLDTSLRGANLEGANLDRVQAIGARFRHAVLIDAVLREANLKEARFDHADLTRADLSGANLYGADSEGAVVHHVQLKNALVAGSRFAAANR